MLLLNMAHYLDMSLGKYDDPSLQTYADLVTLFERIFQVHSEIRCYELYWASKGKLTSLAFFNDFLDYGKILNREVYLLDTDGDMEEKVVIPLSDDLASTNVRGVNITYCLDRLSKLLTRL